MAIKRMDNVGIVVEDLGGVIDFFRELGLDLEGRTKADALDWSGASPASATSASRLR